MKKKSKYQLLYKLYPPVITKDQFYRICNISKKTAAHLLDNGLVPCINSGKKTRKYKIKLDDVIEYLETREKEPARFAAPSGWYKTYHDPDENALAMTPENISKISKHCLENGLSIIEAPKQGPSHYGKWLGDKKPLSWQEKLRQTIDAVMAQKPAGFDAFLKLMMDSGYEVKQWPTEIHKITIPW